VRFRPQEISPRWQDPRVSEVHLRKVGNAENLSSILTFQVRDFGFTFYPFDTAKIPN